MELRYLQTVLLLTSIILIACQQSVNNSNALGLVITDIKLNLCPCANDLSCREAFQVPLLNKLSSRENYGISSEWFAEITEKRLKCSKNKIHLTLSEGSFALLETGELVHVHSKLLFSPSSYCFKKSSSEDYVVDSMKSTVVLEAEVCITPPARVPHCCQKCSDLISKTNDTGVCTSSSAPCVTPNINFDGSSHDWTLSREFSNFRPCNGTTFVVPLNGASAFAQLHLISDGLQLRWKPPQSDKVINVDSSQFCIGQSDRVGLIRPAVAFCRHIYKENVCKNKNIICFGKCCPAETVYDMNTFRCETAGFRETWIPEEGIGNFSVVIGLPSCKSFVTVSIDSHEHENGLILANGEFFISSWNHSLSVPNYCIDVFRNQTHLTPMALACVDDQPEHPEEISPTPYVVLLGGSSALLIASWLFFVAKTVFQKTQDAGIDGCYLLLLSAFMILSALSCLVLALQQGLFKQMSVTTCIVLSRFSEFCCLASMAHIFCMALHHWLRIRKRPGRALPKMVLVAICASPWLVTLATVIATHFAAPHVYKACPVNAAFTDPLEGFPMTVAYALLLFGIFVLLALVSRALSVAEFCLSSEQEERSHPASSTVNGIQQMEVVEINRKNDLPRSEIDRWWLNTKLCVVLLAYCVAYVVVWEDESGAFWVFADIATILRSATICFSLLRPLVRCNRC